MRQAPYQLHVEDDIDSVDVHDLPEEQTQVLAAFGVLAAAAPATGDRDSGVYPVDAGS